MKNGTDEALDTADERADERDAESDASTRSRVMRSILREGPSTTNELAERLNVTPAAIRRHLAVLVGIGHLSSRPQRVYGHRGRGRPSQVFELTDAGRSEFYQAYDALAISAIRYLGEVGGADVVKEFARRVADHVESRYRDMLGSHVSAVDALVDTLSEEGFVASVQPVPSGVQLCLYHCPVAHVARVYPQLCEAEAEVFARLLGSHVQQLATIAHGDGVCTTHVPNVPYIKMRGDDPPAPRATRIADPVRQNEYDQGA